MMRSWWFRILLFSSFSFLLGFSYQYHLPKIERFLLVEIERQSYKHLPVRIWARNLKLHLIPLGVVLEEVHLVAKKPLERYLAPTHLHQVGARLAILPLLRGEIRISRIFVRNSEFNIFLRPELFAKKDTNRTRFAFKDIYDLPIDEISFEGVQVQGRLEPQNVVFRVSDLNFLLENRFRSLFVEINAPRVLVKPSGPLRPLSLQMELRTLVEAREAQISAFKLKADQSFVVASGRFNGDFESGELANGAFDARAKIQLADLNIWEKVFWLAPKLPSMSGLAEVDLGTEVRADKVFQINGDVQASDLKVDRYVIGSVDGNFVSDLKSLKSEELKFENGAGRAQLKKVHVTIDPHPQIQTAVNIENLDIPRFLQNLGLPKIPVELALHAETQCQGGWNSSPELTCKGRMSSPRLHVHTGEAKPTTIIETHNLGAEGELRVTPQQVEYKAEARLGKNSKGRSQGTIHYQDGFKISYEGDQFEFADLKNLANLKLEGSAKVKGTTTGTSRWATVNMDFAGNNLWLEDYPFGELNTKIAYKDGHLTFSEAQGQYEVSRYAGTLDLDLPQKRLRTSLQIPFADLKDLQSLFQRKIDLPFKISGTGQGKIEAQGPLNFQLLSYDVRSSFFRGQVAEETFDELIFNVKSTDGLVKSERVSLTKSSGVAELKGQITPAGEIDTVAVARGMRLEQSENIMGLGFDLQGLADFTVLIRGQLPKPKIELNGRFSRVVLADQPAEDSVVKLTFLSDRMQGSGQFLGQTLIADLTYPYDDKAPFLLKAKAQNWDFTNLFSLVSRSARQLDFSTSISGNINLEAPEGGFWASSGQVQVDEFVIRKGAKSMSSNKSMYLLMNKGVVDSKNFALMDGENFLKLDVVGLTRDDLNASLNGKMDLSLLGLFTPFISDLRGQMSMSMDLRGSMAKPNVSGSAYVDRGYAKLTDFTHPFSNVRADLLFNGNQIVLNSVNADLASGKLSADGRVTFKGDTRPIEVRGHFQDVKLNVPERFRTGGSGTVEIAGDAFPYAMNIDYAVTGGEVTYEIGEDSGGRANVKASSYLPRFMYQETFQPFNFNINVNLKNPVPVNNSLMQAHINGGIRVAGTPDRFLLSGTLTPSPGGKIFFRDVPFDVNSAFVEFNNSPPQQPKIYLTASSRVSSTTQDDQLRTTEQQYDVSLMVQGRGPSPEIVLSSQPPLSQREIVSLLALGVTEASMSDRQDMQAASTSTAVGAGLLQKAAGRRIKDTFGVDVKVSSSQPTAEAAAQPKVTISKQWTPKLGASASSTLQANPSNNVKVEYKMNRNISVIGSWDGREANLAEQQDQTTKNIFGLDLEYKVQFK